MDSSSSRFRTCSTLSSKTCKTCKCTQSGKTTPQRIVRYHTALRRRAHITRIRPCRMPPSSFSMRSCITNRRSSRNTRPSHCLRQMRASQWARHPDASAQIILRTHSTLYCPRASSRSSSRLIRSSGPDSHEPCRARIARASKWSGKCKHPFRNSRGWQL